MLNSDTWLSHPTWYVIPTASKDGSGAGGGTLQGRPTCKEAAHQTDPPEIQAIRQSRWKDGVLMVMDLSQIELRVAALLSGESFFVDAFLHNQDLHARSAAHIVWSVPEIIRRYPELASYPIDTWKKISPSFDRLERQVGKRINFAHLFRSGADTMQSSVLGDIGETLPLEIFEKIARNRAVDLPTLWSWQESMIHEAKTKGAVTLPFTGQSRSFLGGEKYEVNEIVNFPIQTTAGNTLLRIQHRIHRTNPTPSTIKPFLNVYDALYFDCATPSDADRLSTLLSDAVDHVARNDYWHMLQSRYNREIPLTYSLKRI